MSRPPFKKSMEQNSILVVEDQPEVLIATSLVLRSAGYRVWETSTGEQCLRIVAEEAPDLVLLNVNLTDMSGIELCQRIKASQEANNTYVMMFSDSQKNSEDQSIGLESGADGYIMHPIPDRELLAHIRSTIRLKNAETALRKSEHQYRTLVETSPSAIIVHSEGQIVFVNPAAIHLLGATKAEQLTGTPVIHYIHPDYRNIVKQRMKEVVENKTNATSMEQKLIRLDGKELETEVTGIPFNYGGKPAIQAIIRDITASKTAQRQLRESEFRLQTIIEKAVDGVITINKKGIIELVNPALEELFGYTAEELIGNNISLLIPSPHREQHQRYIENYLRTKQSEIIGSGRETTGQRKDGTTLPIYLSVSEAKIEDKILFVGIVHDLTDKIELENILKLDKQILEHMEEGVALVKAEDRSFLWTNPQFDQMFLYNSGELNHCYVEMVDCPLADNSVGGLGEEIFRALAEKKRWRGESKVTRKDGSQFWCRMNISTFEHKEYGLVWVAAHEDVSERKLIEEELRAAKEQAERANNAKSQFLANMSHEIRTPLNAINGFAQILTKRAQSMELPESFTKQLENIQIAGDNLYGLINDILDLSKIEAEKMDVEEQTFSLKQLVESLYQIYLAQTQKKEIFFTYSLDTKLPENIITDRVKLNQILMNLISNAIKFTPSGRSVQMIVSKDSPHILFQIMDKGIGIPFGRWEAIFDSFEQVDSSTTREYGGTGLGLAITKKLVNMLGGNIWVQSEVSKGSTFSFKIPLKEEKTTDSIDLQQKQHSGHQQESEQYAPDNFILVVEDNPMNQEMIIALLEELHIRVELASNGIQGVEKLIDLHTKGSLPDLILMDMHMPQMDGLEATRQIRTQPVFGQIPIIALSADAFLEKQTDAASAGITEYLTKPLDMEKLLPVLNKYLRFQKDKEAPLTEHTSVTSTTATPLIDHRFITKMSPKLRNTLISMFVEQTPMQIEKIQQCIHEENAEDLTAIAHHLKGSCTSVGTHQLAALCSILQEKGKQNDFSEGKILVSQLIQCYEKTVQELSAAQKEIP